MATANAGRGDKKKAAPAKSAGMKRTAAKKNNVSSRRKAEAQSTALRDEIWLLMVIAVAALLILSAFGMAGSLGAVVNSFMFGLFGIVEYILPVAAVVGAFFIVANKNMPVMRIKMLAALVLALLLSGVAQKLSASPELSDTIIAFYTHSATQKAGGGLLGGLLCKLLSPLGTAGTYVVFLLLMLICLVIITERSLLNGIRRSGSRALHNAKDDYASYKRHSDELRMRREERQAQEEEEYQRQEQQRRQRRDKRLEEIRRKEEEYAKRPKRTDHKALDFNIDNQVYIPEPTLITPGDLTEVTLTPEHSAQDYVIEDEYSKDIYDPDELQHSGERQQQKAMDEEKDERVPYEETEYTALPSDEWKETSAFSAENKKDTPEDGTAMIPPAVPEMVQTLSEEKTALQQPKVKPKSAKPSEYVFPPITLLSKGKTVNNASLVHENKKTAMKLQQTLQNFGVRVTITDISCGPSVTRYELQPEQGTKVAKIVSLSDDIKLNLAAADIRIEAPIPGKAAIGIEVPNKESVGVGLRELLGTPEFQKFPSKICFAAGKDISGKVIVADIAKMPHVLIAGATGSGKSVCINTIIMSILYKAKPDEVKLIMVDPKVVELSVYNGIPHLMIPVVTDPKKASAALNWAVNEMTRRYELFANLGVREIMGYNEKLDTLQVPEGAVGPPKLPQIVIIIDELADLMMVAPGEVEDAIIRLAQLARAAGIHLVIATQRPSVNVITGLIKANVPSRISFAVSSGVDSRTILDMNGAEKLLGKGDMLFYPQGYQKPLRVQGAFVSDKEVSSVVDFMKEHIGGAEYSEEISEQIQSGVLAGDFPAGKKDDKDDLFAEAGRFIIDKEKASIGMIQRYFRVGFNRAARIMDQLSDAGVVGPEEGTKPRKILMTLEEFEEYLRN